MTFHANAQKSRGMRKIHEITKILNNMKIITNLTKNDDAALHWHIVIDDAVLVIIWFVYLDILG